ncbi:FAD-dependent oxidoreductase [Arthrobacter sp. NPDC092385]|jgi:2-polyprenyl-6-methoxyphenol hydroxylase-like FAD-dependent oxidoreductase|uniref:ArsR/SmtB family transcription factor n=1 Tax=Arthrobacter sp. NPDC092385 TaxID=3363943 RepID=UPI0038238426
MSELPVVVIGAGPQGLAAAAHLTERGVDAVVVERGGSAGAAVSEWGHVRLFSGWPEHLTCLRDCGIVVAEPEGRQTRYEIADPHLAAALTALVDVTLAVDEHAPCVDSSCTVPGCCGTGAGE